MGIFSRKPDPLIDTLIKPPRPVKGMETADRVIMNRISDKIWENVVEAQERQPSALEKAVSQFGSGLSRAFGGRG